MRFLFALGILGLFSPASFADCISAQKKVQEFYSDWGAATKECEGEVQKAFGANASDSGVGPVAYRMAKAYSDQHRRIRAAAGFCGKLVENCKAAKLERAQEIERYCDPAEAAAGLKSLETIYNNVCGNVVNKTCHLVKTLAPRAKADFWKSYASTRESSSDRTFLMELEKIQPEEISDPSCP